VLGFLCALLLAVGFSKPLASAWSSLNAMAAEYNAQYADDEEEGEGEASRNEKTE